MEQTKYIINIKGLYQDYTVTYQYQDWYQNINTKKDETQDSISPSRHRLIPSF